MSPVASTSFQTTHFVLPAWWVGAFEAAVTADGDGAGAMALAQRAGLAPALTDIELDALAVVLGAMQEQMLAPSDQGQSGPHRLVVDLGTHAKHSPSSARSRRFLFEKVAQLLAGMRLLRPDPAPGDVAAPRACPLFAADTWSRTSEAGSDRWTLTLEPSTLGAECLLGYADGFADAMRSLAGEPEARPLMGPAGPLVVPRSLWLELSPPEQLAFLRLERAMRWDGRWLQLEGVAGLPLAQLCAGLRLADVKGAAPHTSAAATGSSASLAARLRLLARLGRKLTAHGYLAPTVNDQYLAMDPETGSAALIVAWQVTAGTVAFDPLPAYRAALGRLALVRPTFHAEALIRLCASPEGLIAARDMWSQLAEIARRTGQGDAKWGGNADHIDGLELAPGLLASPWLLFFELAQRHLAGNRAAVPLPDALASVPSLSAFGARGSQAQAAAGLGPASLAERFFAFCRWLEGDEGAQRAFKDLPWATVASPLARHGDAARWHSLRPLAFPTPVTFAGAAASHQSPGAAGVQSGAQDSRANAAGSTAGENGTDSGGRRSGATGQRPTPSAGSAAAPGVSGALASRMLRTASDELGRMRSADPDRYKELKQNYLASLDDVGRRLILDVQKRMQPTLFEEHLRQRLVRFMVEHPGSWRSAEAQKRFN